MEKQRQLLMLNENAIIALMVSYFRSLGYTVETTCSTTTTGIDMVIRKLDGSKIHVEAKGNTSARIGSARFGLPFNSTQVSEHVGSAISATLKNMNTCKEQNVENWIVLPDTPNHKRYIEERKKPLLALGIKVAFVSENGIHFLR